LPNLKKNPSALKAMRRDARKRLYRGRVRSSTRTAVRKVRMLLVAGKVTEAEQALQAATSTLDRAAQKGVIHKNNAARRKSRLTLAVNNAKLAA
jgi:small subunit ribosomal protein S20